MGGFTLEAAERVVGASELDVLEGVASLVDRSLLREAEEAGGEARFSMLETIREFAREQLAQAGEEDRAARAPRARVRALRRGSRCRPAGRRSAPLVRAPGSRARQPPRRARLVARLRGCRDCASPRRRARLVLVHARPRDGGLQSFDRAAGGDRGRAGGAAGSPACTPSASSSISVATRRGRPSWSSGAWPSFARRVTASASAPR